MKKDISALKTAMADIQDTDAFYQKLADLVDDARHETLGWAIAEFVGKEEAQKQPIPKIIEKMHRDLDTGG